MMAANKRIMGKLTAPWWMVLAGGLTVLVMALATIAFILL
jgi:Mn2+/Fe2+ NRAMP family transporter